MRMASVLKWEHDNEALNLQLLLNRAHWNSQVTSAKIYMGFYSAVVFNLCSMYVSVQISAIYINWMVDHD